DSFRRRERPGRSIFRADEIYVIENLCGLGIPALPIGRRPWPYVRRRRVARGDAERAEQARKVEPRRLLGGSKMSVDRIRSGVCADRCGTEGYGNCKREGRMTFHGKLPHFVTAGRRWTVCWKIGTERYTICRRGKRIAE